MNDYSIESGFERIDNPLTKKYFQEVISSYHAENYRSAVVMLWSVIICDLIYKLQHLRDVDNDSVAQEMLLEVEVKQKANPNSPDWEIHLLKVVKEKTELLDASDFTNLNSIQQIRHLSAHPVLGNADLLFTPFKEQVRSFIRIALESVLTKPPVFLRKVVDEFVIDIASKKEILLDDISLKRYIESKYFKRLRSATENHLFRALWKFVFRLENDETNENRQINYRCLNILYNRRPNELRNVIRENQDFFSNLGSASSLFYLVQFLSQNPVIFNYLSDSAKVLVENYSNSNLENFSISFFLTENASDHFEEILRKISAFDYTSDSDEKNISKQSWELLLTTGHENNCDEILKKIAILMYSKSGSFNTANSYFDRFIKPIMNQFKSIDLIEFIEKIENNSQTWGRSQGIYDHAQLMDVCKNELPFGFDESEYPNFFRYKKTLTEVPF